jgi:DNA topoisomerase-3
MRLIIAEKGSVAQSIAHAIGASKPFGNKYDIKCYQNDEYIVTNALGHLYDIGEPSDYGFSEWKFDTLPMLPQSFGIFPVNADEKSDYAKAVEKQRNLLRDFFKSDLVTEIICATDAGREGELIFRYIYNANKCEKPVKRLWVSSLTDEAINTAMKNLVPDSSYDNLFLSGLTRAKCDWIYGMNLSRLYSLLDDEVHHVGRVKIPVLSLIVNRGKAVKAHIPTDYYVITLDNGAEVKYEYPNESEALAQIEMFRGKSFRVTSAEKKKHTENPPLLFSLTSLQQKANDEHGLTANDTLKAAQSLYEKRLISYPRTSSEYLTDDMKDEVVNTVRLLAPLYPDRVKALPQELNLSNRIFDNEGVTDHHAIIPTAQAQKAAEMTLNENERNVFKLICDRLLCAVDSSYVYVQSDYIFTCEGVDFALKGISVVVPGWRAYHPEKIKPCAVYTQGETFNPAFESIKAVKKTKEPPKQYTDSTLLSAMQNIDNIFGDKELAAFAKSLENKGIGTPATRAGIIEELIAAGYIERKGKSIHATDFGAEFCDSLPASLKNVEQTARWEQTLLKIEQNENKADSAELANALYDSIVDFVSSTVSQEITHKSDRKPLVNSNPKGSETTGRNSLGNCPRCGKQVFEGKFSFYCESGKIEDGGCGFTLWKEDKFFKDALTAKKVIALLVGETIERKPISKDGKPYEAKFRIADDEKDKSGERYVNLERLKIEKTELGKCPKCGTAVFEGNNSYYCESASKDHPCFTLWKTSKFLSFEIKPKMCTELLDKSKTTVSYKDELSGEKVSAVYELVTGSKDNYYIKKVEN